MIRRRLIAPASTRAFRVFSFIGVFIKEGLLVRDRDSGFLAVLSYQNFDHVADTSRVAKGGLPYSLFQDRVDAQVQGR